jgi:hypothetical protein
MACHVGVVYTVSLRPLAMLTLQQHHDPSSVRLSVNLTPLRKTPTNQSLTFDRLGLMQHSDNKGGSKCSEVIFGTIGDYPKLSCTGENPAAKYLKTGTLCTDSCNCPWLKWDTIFPTSRISVGGFVNYTSYVVQCKFIGKN